MLEFISRLPSSEDVIEKYVAFYGEEKRKVIVSAVELVVKDNYWQQKKWDWDRYFDDLFEKDIHDNLRTSS